MANKKRIATTLGAMALTAVVAIGGTLAYLSSVTETKTNTFSSSKDITTELKETFDPEEASSYTPGQVITKVPTMTNTSEMESVWVAVSLNYTNGASSITADEFNEYATINDLNTKDWEKIGTAADGQELYFYKTAALEKNKTTNAIFSGVTVNAHIQEVKKTGTTGEIVYTYDKDNNLIDVKDNTEIVDETKYYDKNGKELTLDEVKKGLPTFEIEVKGYAVQSADMPAETAKAELIKLANSTLNVEFK